VIKGAGGNKAASAVEVRSEFGEVRVHMHSCTMDVVRSAAVAVRGSGCKLIAVNSSMHSSHKHGRGLEVCNHGEAVL